MGMIQNSLNQLLGTAAIATKLSPTAQARYTDALLSTEIKNMNKASKIMTMDDELSDSDSRIELDNKIAGKAKEKFLNMPTRNNKAIWLESGHNAQQTYDSIMERRKKAMDGVKEKMQAQIQQNEDFEEFYNRGFSFKGRAVSVPEDLAKLAYEQEMNKNKETK